MPPSSCANCGRRCVKSSLRLFQGRRVCTRCRTTLTSQGATTPTPTVAGRDRDDGVAEEEAGGIDGMVGIDPDPFPSSPSGNRIPTFSYPNGHVSHEMVMDGRGTVEERNQGTTRPSFVGDSVQQFKLVCELATHCYCLFSPFSARCRRTDTSDGRREAPRQG